jgi:uncharacterized membrane protein required for colicin V production
MKFRTVGWIAAIAAAFAAGTKVGIRYAKSIYVSKDRKYIEGEVVDKEI